METSKPSVELLPLKPQAVTIRNLNAYFGDNQVLIGIDHQFPRGEITAIMGPSGCGKSTLLKCINGGNDEVDIFKADGLIEVHHDDFEGYDVVSGKRVETQVAEYSSRVEALLFAFFGNRDKLDYERLRREVGMVFQKPVMFPNLNLSENVLTGARKHPLIKSSDDAQRILERSLKQAGIWNEVRSILDRQQTLSGGQEQRMNIARTLATDPSIILMDEPTSKLDPQNSPAVEDTNLKLKAEGKTIIIVTHSGEQAVRLADHIVFLHQGEIIEKGPKKQIAHQPQHSLTRQFLKGSTLTPLPKRNDFSSDYDWRLSVAEQLQGLDILEHICFETGLSPAQLDEETETLVNQAIDAEKKSGWKKLIPSRPTPI